MSPDHICPVNSPTRPSVVGFLFHRETSGVHCRQTMCEHGSCVVFDLSDIRDNRNEIYTKRNRLVTCGCIFHLNTILAPNIPNLSTKFIPRISISLSGLITMVCHPGYLCIAEKMRLYFCCLEFLSLWLTFLETCVTLFTMKPEYSGSKRSIERPSLPGPPYIARQSAAIILNMKVNGVQWEWDFNKTTAMNRPDYSLDKIDNAIRFSTDLCVSEYINYSETIFFG